MVISKLDCKTNNINRRTFLAAFGYSSVLVLHAKSDCLITPSQPIGPFFKNKNLKNNNDMTNKKKAIGEIISIQGNVKDEQCNPHSFSQLTIWQANTFGKYNHKSDSSNNKSDPNFNGYIKIKTDKNGFYKFTTIFPGSYKISENIKRPPHIHLLVITKTNKKLITQLYFKNHPLNKYDFLFNASKRNSFLELDLKKASSLIKTANYNIII